MISLPSFAKIKCFLNKFIPRDKRHWIEGSFVALVLILVAVFSEKGGIEWVGVVAVFITFQHASIAFKLEEIDRDRFFSEKNAKDSYHDKQTYYFLAKEVLWFVYFAYLGAWSALVGVIIFLLYPSWRKTWRKYHKQNKKQLSKDFSDKERGTAPYVDSSEE